MCKSRLSHWFVAKLQTFWIQHNETPIHLRKYPRLKKRWWHWKPWRQPSFWRTIWPIWVGGSLLKDQPPLFGKNDLQLFLESSFRSKQGLNLLGLHPSFKVLFHWNSPKPNQKAFTIRTPNGCGFGRHQRQCGQKLPCHCFGFAARAHERLTILESNEEP